LDFVLIRLAGRVALFLLFAVLFPTPLQAAGSILKKHDKFPIPALRNLPALSPDGTSLDLTGHVSVIVFCESWSPHSRGRLKAVSNLLEKYAAKGVKFVGVNKEKNRDEASAYAANLSFPNFYDENKRLSGRLGITRVPVTVVLNSAGSVVERQLGHGPLDEQKLAEMLERLLPRRGDD
jgi:thiol-disulfide isomerase/thioredoxin